MLLHTREPNQLFFFVSTKLQENERLSANPVYRFDAKSIGSHPCLSLLRCVFRCISFFTISFLSHTLTSLVKSHSHAAVSFTNTYSLLLEKTAESFKNIKNCFQTLKNEQYTYILVTGSLK